MNENVPLREPELFSIDGKEPKRPITEEVIQRVGRAGRG